MNVSISTTSEDENLTNRYHNGQWNNINWSEVETLVNRLQTRITKAVIKENWNLVKRLQYLLVHSSYAKLLAVRKVIQNKGKRTAGVDGERWLSPQTKMKAALNLTDKKYKAKPLKRVYIEKRSTKNGKKKKRPLGIPTMHDRAMQALYALSLDPIAEAIADRTSFGFRKYRSAQDACEQLFTCLCNRHSAEWVLEGDIKGCFDNINHQWLINNTPMDKSVLNQFLKAGFIYNHHLNPTKYGTPQGGPISPILANIALDGIEKLLFTKYRTGKRGKYNSLVRCQNKVNFVRYADDFVVTASSEELAREIQELLSPFLKERGLELSEEKTLITHIDDGFDFLGWNFRKYKGKLLIKPSRDSIASITETIRNTVIKGRAWTQESLIVTLNPIITGWCNYHQAVVSKKVFSNLDNKLWNLLWKWAKRRHPNKSKEWILRKYCHQIGTRKWVFSTENNKLKYFASTSIVRHPKLNLGKNPYLDKEYFDTRKYKQGARKLAGKFKKIWTKQKGKCHFCDQPLDIEEERDLHPIIPIADGRTYRIDNLVYVHKHCYQQHKAIKG